MSMERRALVAFALSMALFFIYDAAYLKPRVAKERARREQLAREAEQQRRADSLSAAERGDTVVANPAPPTIVASPQAQDDAAPPPSEPRGAIYDKTIVVRSSLWSISFSTRGAELISMRLINYETNGAPVELLADRIDETGEGAFAVELAGGAQTVRLHDEAFDAFLEGAGDPLYDGQEISLSEGRAVNLVFRSRSGVERTYRLVDGSYDIEAKVAFDGAGTKATDVLWSMGPGMRATEENVQDDQNNFRASVLLGEEMHQKKVGGFRGGGAPVETFSGTLNWVSLQTKYFTMAAIPPKPARSTVQLSGSKEDHRVSARFTLPVTAAAGGRSESRLVVYAGPLDVSAMAAHGVGLERTVQMGMKAIRPISSAVLWSMKKLHHVIPNYGWVVIIISVLTKVAFFRLTHKSFKSMKEMQELQPRIEAIKQKHKGDQQKVSQETMKLYKEAGVNPLGGCLPMLLQMPVFLALYNVFKFTIELRGAPWFGWIDNLSQQDVLFTLPFSIPFIGDAFSVLPLVMGAAMFAQSKLGGSPTGSSAATPPGFQTAMPILFTAMFYRMPSGLVLYWIVNTVLSVAQQWYIHRESKAAPAPAPA